MSEDVLSPAFPEGWYFVTTRGSPGRRRGSSRRPGWGKDIVVWCDDAAGGISVAESVCPHLGSELGPPPPAAGVRDGRLVCPFHGYEVRRQRAMRRHALRPRRRRPRGLRSFETREGPGHRLRLVGNRRTAPAVEPSRGPAGRRRLVRTWRSGPLRFPGHPQETSENAVDMAHLRYVHGYGQRRPGRQGNGGRRVPAELF